MENPKAKSTVKKHKKSKPTTLVDLGPLLNDAMPLLIVLNEYLKNRDSVLFFADMIQARKQAKKDKTLEEGGFFYYSGEDQAMRMRLPNQGRQAAIRHLDDRRLISRKRGPEKSWLIRINEGELDQLAKLKF